MLESNLLPRKTAKRRGGPAAEAAAAAAAGVRAAGERAARRAERPAATYVSYIPSHMPVRISHTLPGAQGAADITARGGRSKDSCLETGGADRSRRGDPRGSTARTYAGASQQAERRRSREGYPRGHARSACRRGLSTCQRNLSII